MNICILTSSFPVRLGDHVQVPFLIHFMEGLGKRGHRVFLYTQDRKGTKEDFLEGIEVERFPWMKSERPLIQLNPIHPLDCFRILSLLYHGKKSLLSFIREKKIDVCFALWVFPSGYFANYAYRRTGVPYSVWALGSDIYRYGRNPFLYATMKRIIQGARGVFADGFDLTRRVEERFGRKCHFLATTRTIHLEPHELNEPNKPNELNKADKPERPYRFLFVGRLEKVKGIDLLLQSMALLIDERSDVHLTIVGRGRMEGWVKRFIDQRGLGARIEWMSGVSDQELAFLYSSSSCIVIPSRSESIPVVFSEALNFDKPMIVTEVGDMGMLGRQYEVAWVVPPEDPGALKEMMRKRVESQDKGFSAAPQKREELKRMFNIETSVERFLADYK